MAEENELLTRPELRSPRSAAAAGILFAVMQIASMILISSITMPTEFSRDWLETWSKSGSLVLWLVPFSGIAFLWFTGVIRDWLGDREDRFFATIFFGSGILFVGLRFVWAATLGAIFRSYALTAADILTDNDVYIFGFAFMNEIIGNYTLRMAGVYMISIGTLWTRAGVVPRWLSIITYVVALGFLFFADSVRVARYIFPVWVFLVSVYILILNYRRTQNQKPEAI